MSFDAAAAPRSRLGADLGGIACRPPPEIRVDDEDGAAKLTPADVVQNVMWTGDERRRSMPASHNRFIDEPYIFSLSQALALSARRRSEPFMDASAETREISSCTSGSSPVSPHRHVFIDQLASSGKLASPDTWKMVGDERRSSVGAIPKTTTTAAATTTTTSDSLDEQSRVQLTVRASHDNSSPRPDSDVEQVGPAAGSRFLSLPQMSDYLTVPARRHSVALIQPTTTRMLDVIAEETLATDSKNLASSRRYSLSCHVNT